MSLINVLVVDDDPLIGIAIEKLVEWEKNGLKFFGAMRNAAEALEVIKDNDIPIVITDMKMPVMDGLTFIRLAKEIRPDTQFIVLSGFDEYSLVNEAYQLGACNYLLKLELKPESLLQVLMKAAEWVKSSRATQLKPDDAANVEKMERKLFLNRQVLREKLLREYVWGTANEASLVKLREEEIEIVPSETSVMVIEFQKYYQLEQNVYNGEREILKFAVLNVIEEISSKFSNVYYFCNLPHEYVVLMHTPRKGDEASLLHNYFNELRGAVSECFGIIISGGFSCATSKGCDCKLLYSQARKACDCLFLRNAGHLIDFKEVSKEKASPRLNREERIKLLKSALKTGNAASLNEAVSDLIVLSAECSAENIRDVKKLFDIYHYELIDFSNLNGYYPLVEDLLNQYENEIMEKGTLSDLNRWVSDIMGKLAECVGSSGFMNRAKSFIQTHYGESIQLADVAEYLQVSKGHLSRMFNKNLGISFTDYLINVRMEAAIYFMKNTNLKVYEIAEKVGYSSAAQFGRVFKKTIGKSPKEYMG